MKTARRFANSGWLALASALVLVSATLSTAQQAQLGHPHPQPTPRPSTITTQGDTTTVITGESIFPKPAVDPFTKPPGTNFLPTIYTNNFDGAGAEMANTLPSTPAVPYNLHDGEPVVTHINPTSPTDDLRGVFAQATRLAALPRKDPIDDEALRRGIQFGIDIVEGNPIEQREYSGLPLLHYTGPEKVKQVTPILDSTGKVIGGNVDVHQIWFDANIESDTAFVDPSAVLDVPWTVTYTVDVLNRGEDDFAPFVMYVDPQAAGPPKPLVGMDQTFFPMENGTRTVFKIKMAPGKYLNLSYTWGWRLHPPRVQVFENARKQVSINGQSLSLPDWERSVFCRSWQSNTPPGTPANTPCRVRDTEQNKLYAIGKIGDLAPAKRLWTALRAARDAAARRDYPAVTANIVEARAAFDDWRDRTALPRGIVADPQSDLTLFYANNTIYAAFADRADNPADSVRIDFPRWKMRGAEFKATIYNGDNFAHGYQNVDFGGARGWENQFKSSVKVGGSGCWFTFGRAYWWFNIPNVNMTPGNPAGDLGVVVPAANANQPGKHKVNITYNYEPSRRLRFYQFDPIHHDVAVFSVH